MTNYPAIAMSSARRPDIGFIPTEPETVIAMLTLAEVTASDLIYDLGSGDGRILIAAAQQFGAQGVGIDIDPLRIHQAREHAAQAGVSDRVSFREADLFTTDFSAASVVIVYLLPHLNLKLRPQLFRQLQPGARVISHNFDMGDWPPDRILKLQIEEESTLYCWVIPAETRE